MARKLLAFAERPSASGVLEIDCYDVVGESWAGDGFSAKGLLGKLRESTPSEIHIRVNSMGGDAFDGVAIYNLLRDQSARGVPVTIDVDGIAASAASIIAAAGDTVRIASNALMMIHEAWMVTQGPAEDHEASAAMLRKLNQQMADTYAECAKRHGKETTRDDALAAMKAETWMDAAEALEFGIGTETAEPTKAAAMAVASIDTTEHPRAARWTTAYINTLPDAAFAIIKSGGEKDEDEKTTPRSLRMLPHHDESVTSPTDNDSVDLPHLRNALSRVEQADLSESERDRARSHLQAHAEELLGGDEEEETESKASAQPAAKSTSTNPVAPPPQTMESNPMLNKILAALGAKDEAEALAFAEKVPGLITGAQAAIETADALCKVTGKPLTEALAVVEAWRVGSEQVPVLHAKLAEYEATEKTRAEAAAKAERDALIVSALEAGKLVVAQRTWAETQTADQLRAYLEAAPVVVPGAGKAPIAEPALAGVASLTAEDRRVAARMGISLEAFAAAKAETSTTTHGVADADEE